VIKQVSHRMYMTSDLNPFGNVTTHAQLRSMKTFIALLMNE